MPTLKARKRRVRRRSAKKRVRRTKGKKKRRRRRQQGGGFFPLSEKWANCVTKPQADGKSVLATNICSQSQLGDRLNLDAFRDYARSITGTESEAMAEATKLYNAVVDECKSNANKNNVSKIKKCTVVPGKNKGVPVFKQPSKEESEAFGQSGEDFKIANPQAIDDEVKTADLDRKKANEKWHIENILSGIAPVAVSRGGRRKSRRRRRKKSRKKSKKRRRRKR